MSVADLAPTTNTLPAHHKGICEHFLVMVRLGKPTSYTSTSYVG